MKKCLSLFLCLILLFGLLPMAAPVRAADSAPAGLAVTSVTADKTSAAPGENITWSVAASGGSGTIKYCFYVYKDGATIQKGSYSTAKTFSYTPAEAGSYSVKAFVKDGSGTAKTLTGGAVTVTAGTAAIVVKTLTVSKTSASAGTTVTWTASASGGSGTLKYCFYVYKDGTAVQKGSYGTARTCSYTPTAPGTYTVKVFVKDGAGTSASKTGGACVVS